MAAAKEGWLGNEGVIDAIETEQPGVFKLVENDGAEAVRGAKHLAEVGELYDSEALRIVLCEETFELVVVGMLDPVRSRVDACGCAGLLEGTCSEINVIVPTIPAREVGKGGGLLKNLTGKNLTSNL